MNRSFTTIVLISVALASSVFVPVACSATEAAPTYQQHQRQYGATGGAAASGATCAISLAEAESLYLQCTESVTSAPFDISTPQSSVAKLTANIARCGTQYQEAIKKLPCSTFKKLGKSSATAMGTAEYDSWKNNAIKAGVEPAGAAAGASVGADANNGERYSSSSTPSSSSSHSNYNHRRRGGWYGRRGCGGCCIMKFFGSMLFFFFASRFLCCFCSKARGFRRRCHERRLRGMGPGFGFGSGRCNSGFGGGRGFCNFGSGRVGGGCAPPVVIGTVVAPADRAAAANVIDADDLLLQEALRISAAEAKAASATTPTEKGAKQAAASAPQQQGPSAPVAAVPTPQGAEIVGQGQAEPAGSATAAVAAVLAQDDAAWQQVPSAPSTASP